MLHKPKTRVLRRYGRDGFPAGTLGTVLNCTEERVLVRWDDGGFSVCSPDSVVSHQKLKAAFKHGPKIQKRRIRYKVKR